MPNFNNYPYQLSPSVVANNTALPQYATSNNQYLSPVSGSYGYQNQYSNDPVQQSMTVAWVQGEVGAVAYPLAKGGQVIMFDVTPNSNVFWIKSSDPYMGRPSPIKRYRYMEDAEVSGTSQTSESAANANYVPRDEFTQLQSKFDELQKFVDSLK